ncbi:hypothetical protein ABZW18_08150 [Streptomyces sp. NPDC004647]|uniref:hypothetical protein n=1 Tax=Streptomyces sp. NPDC004647 TaxID=3154671 RepID=UPI0033B5899E
MNPVNPEDLLRLTPSELQELRVSPEDLKQLGPRQLQQLAGKFDQATRAARLPVAQLEGRAKLFQKLVSLANRQMEHFNKLPEDDLARRPHVIEEIQRRWNRYSGKLERVNAALRPAREKYENALSNRQALQQVNQARGVVGQAANAVTETRKVTGGGVQNRLMSVVQRVWNTTPVRWVRSLVNNTKDGFMQVARTTRNGVVYLWNATWPTIRNNTRTIMAAGASLLGAAKSGLGTAVAAVVRGFPGGVPGIIASLAVAALVTGGALAWSASNTPDPPKPPTVPGPDEPGPNQPPPGDQPPGEQPQEEPPPGEQPPGEQPQEEPPPEEPPPGEQPPGEQPQEEPPPEEPPPEEPPPEEPPPEEPPPESPPPHEPPPPEQPPHVPSPQ